MSSRALPSAGATRSWPLVAGLGIVLALAGAVFGRGGALDLSYMAFLALAGFAMGGLGLLMIGHLMNEEWTAPIRSEAEAAGLTMPLLLLFAIPLGLNLAEIFPWAKASPSPNEPRAVFLSAAFFLLRGAIYLGVCTGLALWLTRTRHLRRTSAIGLALLTPVMTFAAYDWVLSRNPHWWSSLFGFAFAQSQLLTALAAAILITLLKPERTSTRRMVSLERALLTLSLLAVWTWFAQFLIVWLANLPHEAMWYLERSDPADLWLVGAAVAAIAAAIVVLIPSGVSRVGMIVGSALVLLHHALHLVWIVQPARSAAWLDVGLAVGYALLWGAAFVMAMRTRPTYADEITPQS